jgi:Nucleoside-diphosphate-sugar epimerases
MKEFSQDRSARIFVTGHRGMVGSAITRYLKSQGFSNLLLASRQELDLKSQAQVNEWFAKNRPEYVFHVAGTVGGILANSTRPAEFLYDNIMLQANVVEASQKNGVKKLLYLGSSCIYPRDCPQPIKEEYLLTGPLEQTNYAYALAKISGVKACQAYRQQYGSDFISAMPTNLYGTGDNFDLKNSHVLPALMRKFHEAKLQGDSHVTIWGTGSAMREFLHVDDLAAACFYLMEHYSDPETINVGTGEDVTIKQLAMTVGSIVYPEAQLQFDTTKPDGTPRKLLDVSRLAKLGWKASTSLEDGIRSTYRWFLENHETLRT